VEPAQEGSPTGVLNGGKLLKTAWGIFVQFQKMPALWRFYQGFVEKRHGVCGDILAHILRSQEEVPKLMLKCLS